jgi:hypothetical protein
MKYDASSPIYLLSDTLGWVTNSGLTIYNANIVKNHLEI